MSAQSVDAYFNDPTYQSAIKHLQLGEWEAGLNELDQLVTNYPLSHQLRTLRQEMKLRAQIDDEELEDHGEARKRLRKIWGLRILALVVVLGLLGWAISSYSSWIGQQMQVARQRVAGEVMNMEFAVKFRDGQDLLQVGRYSDAKLLFDEIAAKNPDYPGLAQVIGQTDQLLVLDERYNEALAKINLGEMTAAVEILEAIEAEEPFYKDVSARIADIKGQFFLGDIFAQAEKAYQAGDWAQAASQYETLRALNLDYQTEIVEEHLFESYMNSAVITLSEDNQSLAALEQAETFFRKALALRPQDPVIKLEREQARQSFKERLFRSYVDAAQAALAEKPDSLEALAIADEYYFKALELLPDNAEVLQQRQMSHQYIEAQLDFDKQRWNEVIDKLESLIADDPDYASGTARQTLFEAYIYRGDQGMLTGDYETALSDFQRASVLAEQSDNARLRLFTAQIRVAEAMGALLNYEDAVLLYRSAIDSVELNPEDVAQRPELEAKLRQADNYVLGRSYRSAYRIYREQSKKILFIFPQVMHTVVSGDYLTQIASQYNTTVQAIMAANSLNSAQKITAGQELIIPVQP